MKMRSSQDFAATYNSNKQGFAIAIENYLHLKAETTPGTFVAPLVGTQGKSTGATTPSTDISGGSATTLRINVDGSGVVTATIGVLTGLDTGAEIAAALESTINTALSTAGYDARVWAAYETNKYVVYSQKSGTTSSVVITNGLSNDVATDLKLGVANSGVESAGTYGGDFLKMTKGSLKMNQPFEMSEHRSGRQASNIIKKKKVSEGEIEMYLNVPTSGGTAAVDTPVALLLEGVLGKRTAVGSTAIRFDSTQAPSKYFTICQGNNAFGRQFTGGYGKKLTVSMPGDGEAKLKIPVKARDGKYGSIARLAALVSASATCTVENGESDRFDPLTRVMVVAPDGRTVLAGYDGSLYVVSRTDVSHQVVLSTTVTVEDEGFIVPFLPHVFDAHGTDNPVTGLDGTVSFDGGSTTVEEIRNVEIDFDHQLEDQDNWYGADTNKGFIVGNKAEITVTIELLLSASQVERIVKAKEFTTAAIRVVNGPAGGQRWQFDFPKVYFEVPDVEIPDSGSVPVTLKGRCVQTADGALDAITITQVAA